MNRAAPDSVAVDTELRDANTLRLKARAGRLYTLNDIGGLRDAQRFLDRHPSALILGGGSNVVLAAEEIPAVLAPRLLGRAVVSHDAESAVVELAAGENWHDSVLWTLSRDLSGLENLALIPGSVGAAPVQNIGAYGVELCERLVGVRVLDRRNGTIRWLTRDECAFGYRQSRFKSEPRRWLIVAVRLMLARRFVPCITYSDLAETLGDRAPGSLQAVDVAQAVIAIRRRKLPDPARLGNAGSFFRNPVVSRAQAVALTRRLDAMRTYPVPGRRDIVKLPAAHLIEKAGWKGRGIGDAAMHERHALVLVNRGHASARDVLALTAAVQADVMNLFGVRLDPEPVIVRG